MTLPLMYTNRNRLALPAIIAEMKVKFNLRTLEKSFIREELVGASDQENESSGDEVEKD